MKTLRSVTGIGMVDEYGEIFDKYPYEGEKGFRVEKTAHNKIIYSLEKQKKLLTVPKEVNIQCEEKAFMMPAKPIKYILGESERLLVTDNDLLAVFNTSGKLVALAPQVKFEDKYLLVADKVTLDKKWGAYTYDGDEIFPKEYKEIVCYTKEISGKEEDLFHVVSPVSGMSALYSSDKRLLIPFDFYEIIITDENKVILFDDYPENNQQYILKYDEKEELIAERIS